MISSAEFQQTLEAGKIQQALALLVRGATELDITTQLQDDSTTDDRANHSGYLRTKINLLTGEIHNEVSKDLLASSNSYLKLQQLHHDQIIASDRIVQGYLFQLKAILTALTPTLAQPTPVDPVRLNSDALLARLTQAASLLQDPVVSSSHPHLAETAATTDPDDIDLSIDPDGAVWEEWVEDQDFSTESIGGSDSSASLKSDWEENWVQRHLNPTENYGSTPRHTAKVTNISAQWNNFAPECISIDAVPQPRIANNSDIHR